MFCVIMVCVIMFGVKIWVNFCFDFFILGFFNNCFLLDSLLKVNKLLWKFNYYDIWGFYYLV